MSFDRAAPMNRVTYGRNEDFGLGRQGLGGQRGDEARSRPKQSVNISEDTLLRVARAKLYRMVDQRRGYDERGALAGDSSVGSLLSTKA